MQVPDIKDETSTAPIFWDKNFSFSAVEGFNLFSEVNLVLSAKCYCVSSSLFLLKMLHQIVPIPQKPVKL